MAATSRVKLGLLVFESEFLLNSDIVLKKKLDLYLPLLRKEINLGAKLERGSVFALFLCIYGLSSHLKCSFKNILEKKHEHFSQQRSSFACRA